MAHQCDASNPICHNLPAWHALRGAFYLTKTNRGPANCAQLRISSAFNELDRACCQLKKMSRQAQQPPTQTQALNLTRRLDRSARAFIFVPNLHEAPHRGTLSADGFISMSADIEYWIASGSVLVPPPIDPFELCNWPLLLMADGSTNKFTAWVKMGSIW